MAEQEPRLIFNGAYCVSCEQVLVSTHRHDFRGCACGNFVDGGTDYIRRGGPGRMRDLSLVLDNSRIRFTDDPFKGSDTVLELSGEDWDVVEAYLVGYLNSSSISIPGAKRLRQTLHNLRERVSCPS